ESLIPNDALYPNWGLCNSISYLGLARASALAGDTANASRASPCLAAIVAAVCDRAFFLELTKCGRSQTAPTVGNPSLRLLPRAARPAGCAHRRERNQRRPHACHEEQKTLQSNR